MWLSNLIRNECLKVAEVRRLLSGHRGPLWAHLGLLALKIKRPLSRFTDPNAAAAPAGLVTVRETVPRPHPCRHPLCRLRHLLIARSPASLSARFLWRWRRRSLTSADMDPLLSTSLSVAPGFMTVAGAGRSCLTAPLVIGTNQALTSRSGQFC